MKTVAMGTAVQVFSDCSKISSCVCLFVFTLRAEAEKTSVLSFKVQIFTVAKLTVLA